MPIFIGLENRLYMKKLRNILLTAVAVAAISSCIDKDNNLSYKDIMNVDLTIAVGGDSLMIPLMTTKELTFAEFVKDTSDFFAKGEDGAYKVEFAQSFSIGDQLPSFNPTVAGMNYEASTSVPVFGNLDSAPIFSSEPFTASQSVFNLTATEISALKSAAALVSPVSLDNLNQPIQISEPFECKSHVSSENMEVTSVNDIVLASTSKLNMTVSIPGASSVISAGTLTPNLNINTNGAFKLDGQTTASLSSLVLNAANGYSATKSFTISAPGDDHLTLGNETLAFGGQVDLAGNLSLSGVKVPLAGIDHLNDLKVNVEFTISGVSVASHSVSFVNLSVDIPEQKEKVVLDFDANVSKYITALDSLTFKDTFFELEVEADNAPDFGNDPVTLDLKLKFPSCFMFKDSRVNAKNEFSGTANLVKTGAGKGSFKIDPPLAIKGFTYVGKDFSSGFKINEEVSVTGTVKSPKSTVKLSYVNGTVLNAKAVLKISDITLDKFYGKINYGMDAPQTTTIDIADLPEVLKGEDVSIEFDNPHIELDYTTSVGIPVKTSLSLTPYMDGKVIEANKLDVNMTLDAADPGKTNIYYYWLSKASDTTFPSKYKHVEAPIANLMKRIPEKLDIEYSVATDLSKTHYYDFSSKPTAAADVKVVVPVAFGKDTRIHGTSEIKINSSEEFMSYFHMLEQGMILFGNIYSTLPIGLSLSVKFADDSTEISFGPVEIKAYTGGDAVVSPLKLAISDPESKLKDITKIILDYTVTGANTDVANPVYENSGVKAELKLCIPGGLTLSLNDFISGDEE